MEKGLLQIVEKCENDKELLKEGFELVRDKKVKDNRPVRYDFCLNLRYMLSL